MTLTLSQVSKKKKKKKIFESPPQKKTQIPNMTAIPQSNQKKLGLRKTLTENFNLDV